MWLAIFSLLLYSLETNLVFLLFFLLRVGGSFSFKLLLVHPSNRKIGGGLVLEEQQETCYSPESGNGGPSLDCSISTDELMKYGSTKRYFNTLYLVVCN